MMTSSDVQTSLVSPGEVSDCTYHVILDKTLRNSRGCLLVRRCCYLKEDSLNPFLVRTRLNSID